MHDSTWEGESREDAFVKCSKETGCLRRDRKVLQNCCSVMRTCFSKRGNKVPFHQNGPFSAQNSDLLLSLWFRSFPGDVPEILSFETLRPETPLPDPLRTNAPGSAVTAGWDRGNEAFSKSFYGFCPAQLHVHCTDQGSLKKHDRRVTWNRCAWMRPHKPIPRSAPVQLHACSDRNNPVCGEKVNLGSARVTFRCVSVLNGLTRCPRHTCCGSLSHSGGSREQRGTKGQVHCGLVESELASGLGYISGVPVSRGSPSGGRSRVWRPGPRTPDKMFPLHRSETMHSASRLGSHLPLIKSPREQTVEATLNGIFVFPLGHLLS